MKDRLGGSLVIGALILGLSILTGSYMLKTSLDGSSETLGNVLAEMQANNAKLVELAKARPAPAPARADRGRGGRPDPAKQYRVAVGNSPARGSAAAAIKIVEWSDFQ